MKRLAIVTVALMLVLSLFAGCTSSVPQATSTPAATPAPQQTTDTTEPVAKNVNEFGWEIPEETLEFTYYLAEQTDPEKAAKNTEHYDAFLKEKFNVIIHKLVYNVDPNERINLMLAAGDYPEALSRISNDQVALFVAQNKAVDMAPLVDEFGPTIKSQLGDLYVRYFEEDGNRLFMLPWCWGLLPIPDYAASIRYDYWLEAGQPKFATPDEFYNVLVQLQQAHPTNDNGQRTYALTDFGGGKRMWLMLTGAWGMKQEYMEAADHTLTHWMNTPQGLEIVKFVNKAYRDEQIDPDFLTNQFEQFQDKVSNHRAMGYIGAWWPCWTAGHMVWQKTEENWQKEMAFIQVGFKAPGVDKATLSPKDLTGYSRNIITDKAKNPTDIIKWWNFEISDIGTKVVCFGIPGTEYSDWHYEDGKSIWNDGVIEKWEMGNFDLAPYDDGAVGGQYWMVGGQQKLSDGDPRNEPWCNVWFDQNFNKIMYLKKILHENLVDTTFDNSYRVVQFAPDNPLTTVNTQINDKLLSGWAKMVTSASEADCETAFYELRDDLNNTGLKDLEKFRTDEYKKKLDKWGGN